MHDDNKEYDEKGQEKEGGGFMKKGGKLFKKSDAGLPEDSLSKAIAALEQVATAGDTKSRKEALLEKAKSAILEKSEQAELFKLLGGAEAEPTLGDALVKSMDSNDGLRKSFEVSDFLREQHEELSKSLKTVGDEIQKSDTRRHEFNIVLAKAVCDIGNLVKSMSEDLSKAMGTAARAPKSVGVRTGQPAAGTVLNKSFGGAAPEGEQLTKSQVLDGFELAMEESMSKGMGGKTSAGEDIAHATAKFEQLGQISRPMLAEISRVVRSRSAAAH